MLCADDFFFFTIASSLTGALEKRMALFSMVDSNGIQYEQDKMRCITKRL